MQKTAKDKQLHPAKRTLPRGEKRIRLDKLLSMRGGISRRTAAAKITKGLVSVNGKIVKSPLSLIREAKDSVAAKDLKLKKQSGAKKLYFAFHKPEKNAHKRKRSSKKSHCNGFF